MHNVANGTPQLLICTRRCAGQEGRHPYYSALPAGDGADMLPALYRVYADTIPVHKARVRSWVSGAVAGGSPQPQMMLLHTN